MPNFPEFLANKFADTENEIVEYRDFVFAKLVPNASPFSAAQRAQLAASQKLAVNVAADVLDLRENRTVPPSAFDADVLIPVLRIATAILVLNTVAQEDRRSDIKFWLDQTGAKMAAESWTRAKIAVVIDGRAGPVGRTREWLRLADKLAVSDCRIFQATRREGVIECAREPRHYECDDLQILALNCRVARVRVS